MSDRGFKIILTSEDVVLPNAITGINKDNFIAGGLFDDLAVNSSGEKSGDFSDRKLFDSSSSQALNWESASLTGDWSVDGDLTVSGNVLGTVPASDISNEVFLDKLDDVLSVSSPISMTTTSDSATLSLEAVSASVTTGKTVHVSSSGTNDRIGLSNYESASPFATIRAAVAAASSSDLVIVWPGTYYNESQLLKDGVNIHFLPGAKVLLQVGSAVDIPFKDSIAPVTATISGNGEFTTSDNTYCQIIKLSQSQSKLSFSADKIECSAASPSHNFVVKHEHGNLLLACDKILGKLSGLIQLDGKLIIRNSYISGESGSAIEVGGQDAVTLVDNCQLQAKGVGAGALYLNAAAINEPIKIKNSIFQVLNGTTYSITANAGEAPTMSILPGNCGNKDLQSSDIQVVTLAPFTYDSGMSVTFI